MKTKLLCALALMLVTVSAGALAQGDFPLRYKQFHFSKGENVVQDPFPMVSKWLSSKRETPPGLPEHLSGEKTHTFLVRIAGKDLLMGTTLSRDPMTKLFIDLDGDGTLSDENRVRRHPGRVQRWYGPVQLPVIGPGGTWPARFNVATGSTQDDYLALVVNPAGYRTGKIRLGARTYTIAITDGNLNGRYNEACSGFDGDFEELDCDSLAIDLDNNGRFDPDREVCPLTKTIYVRGVCYSLTVLPDGSKVRLKQVDPKFDFGELDVGDQGMELVLFSPALGLIPLQGHQGKWKLPAGEYTVMFNRLHRTDSQGVKWSMTQRFKHKRKGSYVTLTEKAELSDEGFHYHSIDRRPRSLKTQRFTVPTGGTARPKIGLPLRKVTYVTTDRAGRDMLVEFGLVGQGGEEYPAVATAKGHRYDRPDLQIIGEEGEILEEATLGRTRLSTLGHSWEIPKRFNGKFRAEVTPHVGPFEVASEEEKWLTVGELAERHKQKWKENLDF